MGVLAGLSAQSAHQVPVAGFQKQGLAKALNDLRITTWPTTPEEP